MWAAIGSVFLAARDWCVKFAAAMSFQRADFEAVNTSWKDLAAALKKRLGAFQASDAAVSTTARTSSLTLIAPIPAPDLISPRLISAMDRKPPPTSSLQRCGRAAITFRRAASAFRQMRKARLRGFRQRDCRWRAAMQTG